MAVQRRNGGLLLALVYAPGGAIVGRIVQERSGRVFERPISEHARAKVLFRDLDGWPLGQFAFDQVQQWKAAVLRYSTPEGVYEVSFASFCEHAAVLDFPHERQRVLPRRLWSFTPSVERRPAAVHECGAQLALL